MAANDEEFEQYKQEALDSLKNKNYDKAAEEIQQIYADARAAVADFKLSE